jgi:DNA-binding MarR family transcriptional regulator
MQTSKATSPDQLADELLRFIGTVMKGDQGELFEIVAELDLTMPQMRGMFMLAASEQGLALTELAPRMGLSVAAAGRAVDGLVRNGLVSRTEDAVDRRIKRLALTDAGHAALARIGDARREGLRRFADGLGEDERGALSQGLAVVFGQWDVELREETP